MGIDATVLHTVARAASYAVGFAVALAVGTALGWGGKDYVADNVDDWVERSTAVGSGSKPVTGDD